MYHQHFSREDDMFVWVADNDESIDDASDSPPTTITVVEILPDFSTSIPSYTTLQPDTLASVSESLETTTSVTITASNALSYQTSTSSISLSSSISPSSSTLSPPTSSAIPLSQDTKTASASSLNPGAIAGIVTVCVFAFIIGIFFAIRTWFKKRRASNLRKTWPRSSLVRIRYGADAPESSYEPKFAPGNGDSRGQALSVQIPSSRVSMPPISYNNDAVLQYAASPVTSSPSAFTSPVYSAGLTFMSPYSTTVVCTFIPSLPDELTVYIGETLRVLAGYEDGWSLCMDYRGEQGMVPNECLEQSSSILPNYGSRILRSSTRVTSLAPGVRPGH